MPLTLYCGTFFWYVENRKEVQYPWFYPELECAVGGALGLCMPEGNQALARRNWIPVQMNTQWQPVGNPTPIWTLDFSVALSEYPDFPPTSLSMTASVSGGG